MLNQFVLSAISYLTLKEVYEGESHAIDLVGPGKMVESKIVT